MSDDDRQPVYLFEGFRLDARRRVLFGSDGQPIPLTSRLFDTLLYLVERPGELVTKEQLLEAIWPHAVVEEQSLGKAISALRKALGEKPDEHRFIVTKHGRGYRFVARVTVIADVAPSTVLTEPVSIASVAAAAPAVTSPELREREPRTARRYQLGAALGITLLLATAALLGAMQRESSPQLRVTPLSLEAGGQRRAVWSPDGKSVAYAARASAGEPFRLLVRDIGSPTARTVVSNTGCAAVPLQWTTTGRIVYGECANLWSVSPVGAIPEAVDIDHACCGAVSRDGMAFAAVRRNEAGQFGVWTGGFAGTTLEEYAPAPFRSAQLGNADLKFSPDGRQLLLKWLSGGGEQFWLLPFPADPRRPPRRVLEGLPVISNGFSWLPDNVHIVVATAPSTNSPQLYIANTRSGAFRQFTYAGADYVNPAVSPDGERVAYLEVEEDFDIVTLALDDAGLSPLIATKNLEQAPAWAGAAPAMVYATTRSGPYEIWLNREGQSDRRLVTADDFPPSYMFEVPTLSPDASRLIFQVVDRTTGSSHLLLSSVADGMRERLTDSGSDERGGGAWSPDGAWYVLFVKNPDGSDTLKKVRTTGRARPETVLASVERARVRPAWSPYGEWILLADRGMKLVSPDGKSVRDLGIENAPCAFARPEPLIYCLRAAQPDGYRPFVALDFDGKVVKDVGLVPVGREPSSSAGPFAPGLTLSLTPDGLGVTFATRTVSQGLWLMEGLSQVPLP